MRGLDQPADQLILDRLGEPVMVVDGRRRIVRFNASACELTGLDASDVLQRSCAAVLKASLCTRLCPALRTLGTSETCRFGAAVIQGADGQPLVVDVVSSPLARRPGARRGAIVMMRDARKNPGQLRIYSGGVLVSGARRMRQVFEMLPKLASSRAPLLVVGAAGTGRSALVRAIHNLAPGASPLVRVSCESLSERGQISRPEDGSTLLLEDICRAPEGLQLQLLSWIEEGAHLRFRLASTATDELEECVERGGFRRDLYYRLGVLRIDVPSLADRAEDIPLLVEQFIEELNVKRGTKVPGVSAAAMRRLMEAEFPTNIRQLRDVIAKAHGRRSSGLIEPHDLPPLPCPGGDETEREVIAAALRRNGGNATRAARELGIHRTTLWRKIKRYKISS